MVLKELLNELSPPDDPAYWVVEEGLNGRTTCREDPIEGDKNGLRQLPPILESHAPIDIVVVMLGSNDLKSRFNPCAFDIATGAGAVVTAVRESHIGPGGGSPVVLMICPPPLIDSPVFKQLFGEAAKLSKKLPGFYRQAAQERGAVFLDAGKVIRSSKVDGLHFDPGEHRKLAEAVAAIVKTM
jgi:lysophospholipase L1-like esterase